MDELNGNTAIDSPLSAIEYAVLEASWEATERQQEMLPLVARALGVAEEEVFYTWANRRCKQRWTLDDTGWRCYFHGLECDLVNTRDGRQVRLDFGPDGRVDTCNAWGVLMFVMTSAPPWPEYPELRRQFVQTEPQTNAFAGNTEAFDGVWARLAARGAFEPARPDLVDFQNRHTSVGADGLRHVRLPEGTPEKIQFDCMVAHRTVISPHGLRMLSANPGTAHNVRTESRAAGS